MADEVEEKDEDDWSEAMTEDPNDQETSKNKPILEVSSVKIYDSQFPAESNAQIPESASKVDSTIDDKISFQVTNSTGENVGELDAKNPITENHRRQPRSECRAHSRNTRQCQKHFQEMVGKHEIRNEELEQQEGDLRQRLQTLECSMPAVMVWNVWRMAQSAPTSVIRRLMEKQLQGYGAENVGIPTTPSQHWDDRVRRMEAERKEAFRRAEEARALLAEKEVAVHERRERLEEAKKCNQERKEKMEKLGREAAELREALKNARGDDNSCETGECGEIRCKEKWLAGIGSVSSIASTELECFAKLQELAEAEICMKRQISELERREEAYMRTLQQADEMWSKMEGDTADTVSELQDQLDLKNAANQQLADRICQLEDELENLKTRLMGCKDALSKFTSKEYSEVSIGWDDGEADVKDGAVVAAVKTATASAAATPETLDEESLAYPETRDKESNVIPPGCSDVGLNAIPKTFHKSSEAIPAANQIHRGLDPVTELGIDEVVGDDNDIPEHWKNWNWDDGCPPDIICDGMVECSTGTDDVLPSGFPTTQSKVQTTHEMVEQSVGGQAPKDTANFEPNDQIRRRDASEQVNDTLAMTKVTTEATETLPESDQIVLTREELRNWYNIVDSVHHMIAKCDNCSSKSDDTALLAEKMKLHLRVHQGAKGIVIMEEILREPSIAINEHMLESPAHISTGETRQKIESDAAIDDVDLPDETTSTVFEDIGHIVSEADTPNVADEVKIPSRISETADVSDTSVLTDAERTPLEMFDNIADAIKSQSDLTSKPSASTVKKMPVSTEESQPVEIKSKDAIADIPGDAKISEDLAEIQYQDNLSLASIEPSRKPENMLSVRHSLEGNIDVLTTSVPIEAETTSPEIVDKIADAPKSQSGLMGEQPIVAAIKTPVSIEELHSVEKISKDASSDLVTDIKIREEFAETPDDDSLFEAPIESMRKSENFLPNPQGLEVESGKTTEPSEKLSSAESLDASAEDFNRFKSDTSTYADKTEAREDVEEQSTHTPESDTLTEMPMEHTEEAEETIRVSKEEDLTFEASTESSEQPPELPSEQDDIESPLQLDVAAKDNAAIEETPPSFITPRTPPPSKIDVEPEIKSRIPSADDFKDDLQSRLDVIHRIPSSGEIVVDEHDSYLSAEGDVANDIEQMPEFVAEEPDPEKLERFESDKVSIITVEAEERLTIVNTEGSPQLEAAISEAQDDVMPDSETKSKVSKVRSHSDALEIEQPTDKLLEGISSEGEITLVPERADVRKPYLAIAKVESPKKLELPKHVGPCICKPRTCPLLGRSAGRERKLKVPRVDATRTQITPPNPKSTQERMDKQRLKTISESTWPPPEVELWRRATIWPRRPRDKSTLTTVCVDTQTDSALVRERIPLEGITRKDDCTCSGACPRKTEHGGCVRRISNRPLCEKRPEPAILAVDELFDAARLPTIMASSARKEKAVIKYTGRSLIPQESEFNCVECGKPMTSEGTPRPSKCTLPSKSRSQKSTMASIKKVTSSMSRVAYNKDNFTCCECKTSGKLKNAGESRHERENNKNSERKKYDQDVCCPCPSKMTKKSSSKSSKKKRKPETKDQGTMANIPRSTVKALSKETKDVDVNKTKSPRISHPDTVSYCECDELINETSIAESEGSCIDAVYKTPKENVSCDCFLRESVSKGSNCNCTPDTNEVSTS